MERIASSTRAIDLFGAGKDGFRDGNPLDGTPATRLTASFFNALQEELARVVEAAGMNLDPESYTQLLDAIRSLGGAGLHTIWVPAAAMYARTTNGAAAGAVELANNNVMVKSWDFDAAAQEFVQFAIAMPGSWDEGTLTAHFIWTAGSGAGGVVWGIQALAVGNDDPLDAAFSAGYTAVDALLAPNDEHFSPQAGPIAPAGAPAPGDLLIFQVRRDVAHGSDTLGVDAKLLGVRLHYTTNKGNDA